MVLSTPVNGKTVRHTVKVYLNTLMGMFMMANGKMIKLMVLEPISIKMGQDILENGRTMFNTGKERKHGMMDPVIMVCTMMERNTDRGFIPGAMDPNIMVDGLIIKYQDMLNSSFIPEGDSSNIIIETTYLGYKVLPYNTKRISNIINKNHL